MVTDLLGRRIISCPTKECKQSKKKAHYVRDQYSKPHKKIYEVFYCANCRTETFKEPRTRKSV